MAKGAVGMAQVPEVPRREGEPSYTGVGGKEVMDRAPPLAGRVVEGDGLFGMRERRGEAPLVVLRGGGHTVSGENEELVARLVAHREQPLREHEAPVQVPADGIETC